MNFIAPRAEPHIREIPLSRLALAPENVRKTPPDAQTDAGLKASIAAFGLLPAAFPGLAVEDPVQTADLLAGQETREPGSAVGPDALRGVLLDVAASDREVHDLPE